MSKAKLQKVLKSPMNKIICVDLDETLSVGSYWGGKHPKVNEKMATFVRELNNRGAYIVIYTARLPKYLNETYRWLEANNLSFPIALRIKTPADLYLDDKALNVDDIKL